jgi:hypothetical protein
MALIGAASEFDGPGFLLPTRNQEVFKWCLEAELKLVFQRHGLASVAAMQRSGRYQGILLQQSFCTGDRKFWGPPMRFSCKDVGGRGKSSGTSAGDTISVF